MLIQQDDARAKERGRRIAMSCSSQGRLEKSSFPGSRTPFGLMKRTVEVDEGGGGGVGGGGGGAG